jgi:hypothetical protein
VRHGEAHGKEKQLTAPPYKRHVTAFAVRWQKTHGNLLPLPCAVGKNARQSFAFAVRHH